MDDRSSLAKVGVAGSNPVVRSKHSPRSRYIFASLVGASLRLSPAKIPSLSRLSFGIEPQEVPLGPSHLREQVEELQRMSRLRRFLSPTLAELILSQGESLLKSHRREIAVLFADLRGWTAFSVTTEPEEVMGVIGEFHAAMGNLILEFEATVGWFAGDGQYSRGISSGRPR
jgi:hypothetical protein